MFNKFNRCFTNGWWMKANEWIRHHSLHQFEYLLNVLLISKKKLAMCPDWERSCFQVNKTERLGNAAVSWKSQKLQNNKTKYSCSFQIGSGIKGNFVIFNVNEREKKLTESKKKKRVQTKKQTKKKSNGSTLHKKEKIYEEKLET